MPDPHLAEQFVDLRQQQNAAELGLWTFVASEVLFFGGLFLAYSVYRIADPTGFAAAARHTEIVLGTANTAVLLTSSFLVAWAVAAARAQSRRTAAALLWMAAVLGVVFLVIKGFEYRREYDEHLIPGLNLATSGSHATADNLFFSFYFAATGVHAIHVALGIAVIAATGLRAWQGAYSAEYHAPITVAGLYWHFVDVVWIVLFALIYLPGRAP